jgi:hypothetical protein
VEMRPVTDEDTPRVGPPWHNTKKQAPWRKSQFRWCGLRFMVAAGTQRMPQISGQNPKNSGNEYLLKQA